MENDVLIILGMHRSGTSLIAQWIMNCGLNLGDNLLGSSVSNNDGHFEDIDFLNLHEEILNEKGLGFGGFENFDRLKLSKDDVEKLAQLTREKNKEHSEWGWKEPRTCLFIDYYQNIMPSAKILFIYRNYNNVVDSLIRRDLDKINTEKKNIRNPIKRYLYFKRKVNLLKTKYLNAWIEYNTNILKVISKKENENFICISLDQFLSNDLLLFKRIKKWGFEINYKALKNIYKNKELKRKKLKLNFSRDLENKAQNLMKKLINISNNLHE